jgi:hypothetical protein
VNADFLANHRRHVQEDKLASAEQKTKELLKLSAQLRNDLDVDDSDADDIDAAMILAPVQITASNFVIFRFMTILKVLSLRSYE